MTLDEIKTAVQLGKAVHWATPAYVVMRDHLGQYLIAYRPGQRGENYIGLTHRDGVTLNGREDQFYIAEPVAC